MLLSSLDCGHGVQTYCVRLMNYIAGKTIAETPVSMKDLYEVGKLAATVDMTLQDVSLKMTAEVDLKSSSKNCDLKKSVFLSDGVPQ